MIALLLAAAIQFQDATPGSGIGFVHHFGAQKLGSLLESTGAGCTWLDFNNDGLQDLYLVSGKPLPSGMHPFPLRKPPPAPVHNRLYRNDGNGKFTDVTGLAGVGADLYSMGAVAADYDRDGFPDLFLTGYGRAVLYRNQGNGTFEDATERAGLKVAGWSIGSAWLDYDRDGCVDLFVGRYVKFDPAYRAYYAADNYPGPLDYEAESNRLFRNRCDGTFVDVSEQAGIADFKARAMGVTAADFDGDGFADIYVANDKTENFLFHNQRDGTFKEVALEAGVAFGQNGEATSAMGPVFADFDRDGRTDLWVSDSKYNRLWQASGKLRFKDITEAAGISQLSAQYVSWGTGAHDFDNDGRTDIFIVHGGLVHLVPQEHSLFRNLGGGKFEDVSAASGPFFEVKSVGRGACFADYDNDGRVDLYLVNLGGPGYLLRNTTPPGNHWLKVKLVGRAVGAKVEVTAGGQRQQAEVVAGAGYLSQDDERLHFGMGSATRAESVTVTWPGGKVQTLQDVAADRILRVEEK